jgi:hypothetical protein
LQLNLVRNAAPSATVAPFPGTASANPHALPPSNIDPEWARAAAQEGMVAYKNLLGPNQNMSHIPGADVEAQEITTVADMLNFETKKQMYKRFSTGFGVFMIAQLCEYKGWVWLVLRGFKGFHSDLQRSKCTSGSAMDPCAFMLAHVLAHTTLFQFLIGEGALQQKPLM